MHRTSACCFRSCSLLFNLFCLTGRLVASISKTHALAGSCSSWLSASLSIFLLKHIITLRVERSWHFFWNAASIYQYMYIYINAYLYINIWMCPHPQKWAVDLDGLLGNVNFSQKKHIFPSLLTEEQESKPWKRCWKRTEWLLHVRETAGLWHTHVVSLLVIGKAGHT